MARLYPSHSVLCSASGKDKLEERAVSGHEQGYETPHGTTEKVKTSYVLCN